jgi:hypothetical protein
MFLVIKGYYVHVKEGGETNRCSRLLHCNVHIKGQRKSEYSHKQCIFNESAVTVKANSEGCVFQSKGTKIQNRPPPRCFAIKSTATVNIKYVTISVFVISLP